ncbi:MAG TPA: class I SAM-dependent methyltransferase [Thermoanaerobaculia bacterium]|nr:class I SAM-dependent methyltransferase [Thermoanaerobaculia bacterium]
MSDDPYVEGPPSGQEGWSEVWRADRRYKPGGMLQRMLDGLLRRGTALDRDRQRDFNLVILDLLHDIRSDVEAVRRDLRADFDALQRDMKAADQDIARDVAGLRELLPFAVRRNDALIAALDQKIETLAVRLRDVTNPLVEGEAGSSVLKDFVYRRLEDGLRGSGAEVREAMEPYLALARERQPVLDIGCGRGEFLELCREAGVDAYGYDTNERSVADLKKRGLAGSLAGVPECFQRIDDGSIGSILAAHVVEHLPAEHLFALFREAHRVLRSGGLLMIETPNAESLLVSASEFWRDPTHLAPRHPAALTLLASEHGFDVDDIRAIHPFPEGTALAVDAGDAPSIRRVVEAINERLFGPQDLRMIVRRR